MVCAANIHELYGKLAASLVDATAERCEPDEPRTRVGAKLNGSAHLSVFKHACSMLIGLGLATYECKLLVDGDQVEHFVTKRSRTGQVELPPINDVLEAWLSMFGGQLGYASLKRLPFVPHENIRPVMDALSASAYVERIDDAFLWTNKIGRAMRMGGWWDENGLSREELEERDIDLDMRNALASIPDDVRQAALSNNRVSVVRALATRWIDGMWLPHIVDEVSWWRLAALAPEATRLMELIERNKLTPISDVN